MIRHLLGAFALAMVLASVPLTPAEARNACGEPVTAGGKPSPLRPDAERLAVSAWNARVGAGSPFSWDNPATQKRSLACVQANARHVCEATAIPCAPAGYEACRGAFLEDSSSGQDYCGSSAGSGDSISARMWLVSCGGGYRLKIGKGPDRCEIDPRWTRR